MAFPNDPTQMEEENESAPPRSGSRLASWLIIFGLGLLFLPLYLITSTIKDTTAELQTELDSLQATLSFTPPPNPSEEALNGTLAYVRLQDDALQSLEGTLVGIHIDWPAVMAIVGAYDPAHMGITAVTQNGSTIVIGGQADNQSTVSAYAEMLRTSGRFGQVDVGSITIEVLPTPTPTPTATPVPESTAEPTLEPTQVHEPESIANFEITVSIQAKAS
jgi:hypothetical protein